MRITWKGKRDPPCHYNVIVHLQTRSHPTEVRFRRTTDTQYDRFIEHKIAYEVAKLRYVEYPSCLPVDFDVRGTSDFARRQRQLEKRILGGMSIAI